MTEDEMVAWHHQFNGREFEQAPGIGDGQGGLACCIPWGCKEADRLSDGTELKHPFLQGIFLTQRSNPNILHCRQILYHLSHLQSSPSLAIT